MATKSKSVFDDAPEWPDQAKPASGGMGHNRPPVEEDVKAQFREQLLSERPDFLSKVDEIETAVGRVMVESDDDLARAGDFVKLIRTATKHVDDTHKSVKAPYLAAGRVVDAEKNALTERLAKAKREAEKPMNAYAAKKDAERQAEEAKRREAERRQAEQAAARQKEIEEAAAAGDDEKLAELAPEAAPAASPEPEPVRSDTGTAVTTQTTWHARVDDYELAFMHVSENEKVREAIDKAIAAQVRAGVRKIEGVTIYPTKKTVSR